MKFIKKEMHAPIQENKISCWDIAKQSFQLMNECFDSLEKTLKSLKNDSNLLNKSQKISSVKNDSLMSQTIQELRNSINLLKVSKMNVRATIDVFDTNSTTNPLFNLPN